MHADVIDRLDFTGVGPSMFFSAHASSHPSHLSGCLVFHHDGPFDACAPSRNRHRTKAPIYAWTSINAEDEEVAARYRDKEDGSNPVGPTLTYDTSYPPDVPRSSPATTDYASYYPEPPKRRVDALAEAWGIHEPEPYEEFFAGGGDLDGPITNGNSRDARSNSRRTRDDLASRPRGSNRPNIPPPQPIFVPAVPEPGAFSPQPSPEVSGGANISRNKSLIQRIRKMRDAPNVPVSIDEMTGAPNDGAPSPTSSTESGGHGRPAYRPRDSLLGRFVRQGRGDGSPTTPVEPYVYVSDGAKDLPAIPTSPGVDGYYDRGLGRKTSIMKKVKGVVRGNK
jgi:Pal1 cell morphology protein